MRTVCDFHACSTMGTMTHDGRLHVSLAVVVAFVAAGARAFPNTTTGHTLFAPFTLAATAEVPDTFLSFNFDVSLHHHSRRDQDTPHQTAPRRATAVLHVQCRSIWPKVAGNGRMDYIGIGQHCRQVPAR